MIVALIVSGGGTVTVDIADAYDAAQSVQVDGTRELVLVTGNQGGWYDVSLTSPHDSSFACQLAGRVESGADLTSDPQPGNPQPAAVAEGAGV